jgi:hypothetical protein
MNRFLYTMADHGENGALAPIVQMGRELRDSTRKWKQWYQMHTLG